MQKTLTHHLQILEWMLRSGNFRFIWKFIHFKKGVLGLDGNVMVSHVFKGDVVQTWQPVFSFHKNFVGMEISPPKKYSSYVI